MERGFAEEGRTHGIGEGLRVERCRRGVEGGGPLFAAPRRSHIMLAGVGGWRLVGGARARGGCEGGGWVARSEFTRAREREKGGARARERTGRYIYSALGN